MRTIRDWSKEVLTKYVEHHLGEKGWEKFGSSPPDAIVDAIFAQIQVTLLGYAADTKEANAKHEAIDRMLIIKE
jgi:hypothetical protein